MKKEIYCGARWILCNLLLCLVALISVVSIVSAESADTAATEEKPGIEISFSYQSASTMASNQIAVWVENEEGSAVKNLLVTDFTAGRRGYRNRDMALPAWVEAYDPETMTDEEIDALSSATPGQGQLAYVWDFTNDLGEQVPEGVYSVHVEGTLFWESDVLYTAKIDTAHLEDEITVEMERTAPDSHDNENMITDVRVSAIGGGK